MCESCLQQDEVGEGGVLPYLQVVLQALDVRHCVVCGSERELGRNCVREGGREEGGEDCVEETGARCVVERRGEGV